MNKYQAKLEAIKSKRISKTERFQSLLIFISMAFSGLFLLPFYGLSLAWSIYEVLVKSFPRESLANVHEGAGILMCLTIIFLIFYLIGIGLKHLTLFLSGIKEN